MGLIIEEIETEWRSRNIQYYKNKGYKFTNCGDKFLVNSKDLSSGSHVIVNVKCDNCLEELSIPFSSFSRCNKNGKYYCKKCSIKLYGLKNSLDTRRNNSISFMEWCLNNNRQDILKLWDYKLNNKFPEQVSYGSKSNYYFKCPLGIHESFKKCVKSITSKNFKISSACDKCNSFEFWCEKNNHIDYLKLWDYKLNKCSPNDVRYGSHSEYYFKCPLGKHRSHNIVIKRIVSGNTNICPYCVRERTKSFLQEKVDNYICKKYNYKINHEYDCSIVPINPRTKMLLPFDNEIEELRLIIESNGKQHYAQSPWHNTIARHSGRTPEQEFKYQRIKDRYKRIIAKQNGFEYLEIPFWTEKDESYKQLIDDKINEILSQEAVKKAASFNYTKE
jgi:hypothetical protein